METTKIEQNRRFAALVANLPSRTIVVGQHADGTAITIQVHSAFGAI